MCMKFKGYNHTRKLIILKGKWLLDYQDELEAVNQHLFANVETLNLQLLAYQANKTRQCALNSTSFISPFLITQSVHWNYI